MAIRTLWRIVFALLLAVILPTTAIAAKRVVEGEVTYRERIALPGAAMIEVTLVDVSRQGAPMTVARTTFRARTQAPFRYRLSFDDRRLDSRHAYALRARILVNGKLWFASPADNPLPPGEAGRVEILVQRAGGPPEERQEGPAGRWLAEDIGGAGVIDRLQSVLVIDPDGKVSGSGGCNRIMGRAEIAGPAIKFGPIATTYMLCVPAAMDQEGKFIAALGAARAWRIDAPRGKLILLDADGKPVLVLARQ